MLQTFGLINPDNARVADLPILAQAIADRPKDYLQQLLAYYLKYGGIFKVCLLPKAFLIVSDPVLIRHILAENALKYDKGILADILEPIMVLARFTSTKVLALLVLSTSTSRARGLFQPTSLRGQHDAASLCLPSTPRGFRAPSR